MPTKKFTAREALAIVIYQEASFYSCLPPLQRWETETPGDRAYTRRRADKMIKYLAEFGFTVVRLAVKKGKKRG